MGHDSHLFHSWLWYNKMAKTYQCPLDFEEDKLENPKIRLALQNTLLNALAEIGEVEKVRFKLGEIYQLWGDVEVTFMILAKGISSNQASIYAKLAASKDELKTKLEAKVVVTEVILSDKERTHTEAKALVPKADSEQQSPVVTIHDIDDEEGTKKKIGD